MLNDDMLALPMAADGGMGDFAAPATMPMGGDLPMAGGSSAASSLSGKAKAAIVVRLLLNEGADIPIEELPDQLQMELTQQMGKMRLVDRDTLYAVASEFAELLDNVGLTFPNGLAGALTAMDGRISRQTATRLRKEAGVRQFGDPWEHLKSLKPIELAKLCEAESIEVAAVLLSKLDTAKAAEMLAHLPGPVARQITYAVSHTSNVTPDTVDRIGLSLAAQVASRPEVAFASTPGQRVGAILTEAAAAKRDEVLTALEEEDEEFATDVRKSIYTYALIAKRMDKADVPKLMRVVSMPDIVTSIAFATDEEDVATNDFLLENMSKRMAENIREEAKELGSVKRKDGEAAFGQVISAMRDLANMGDIELKSDEEAEE
ncbi:flagellar motor switch protein FliG [Roseobacter sp. SK209-2-6]|uniref:flagellar motor switch protein FliG n=1 Tax=Roseobacter sp. SK209-2-6 TaxID=388739 RepID=UPI0000F3E7DB|nr:FliG C-terminal domain-containing protein [Roseobacter sp. SK209-2-6]EBA16328.1 flagellar motor switch protein FliG [Roseobacter sp. SK209-2-6]